MPHRADVTRRLGGFTIPKHTQVVVNAWAIARDASYWENPTSFLPERFISSNIDSKGKNFQFIPFGAGRRMCVGMALGHRMVHLVLASLLQAFSWELPQGIEPERVNVEAKFGITLHKAVPLIVFPSPLMDINLPQKTSNLPPGPVGLPVVGSLFQLGGKPYESLARLSKQYGPLMTLRLGLKTTVVVSSAGMAEEVLLKHDRDLAGRTGLDATKIFNYAESSITMNQNCPRWRELRRLCNNELFLPKRLDAMRGHREEKVQALLKHIQTASAAGRPVNIGKCTFTTSLNLLSRTVFSEDVVDVESESAGEFKSLAWELSQSVLKANIADYFPMLRLVDPQGIRRRSKALLKEMFDFLDKLIDKRLQSYGTGEGRKKESEDFFDVLLRLVATPSSGFTRQNIRPLLTDIFVAGAESTSITVEWAMAELLRHPDKMAAARSELKQAIGIGRAVQESDIPRLPYLHAVVKETLRLHTPGPILLPRRADVTVQVAGFTIPKHTEVLVNAWAICRDDAYWENATSFLPERFIGSDVDFNGKHYQFIPFGAGRRMCVGKPLAERMVHLVLASLLNAFTWELPQGMEPEQLDMEAKDGVTLPKAVPLIVFPSPLMEI
ncbi:Geraniol 8-hydroxylase [Nymphaea thermarum]|nr:Geraniol 8-hydroxylase [Nymphaea thermarum]